MNEHTEQKRTEKVLKEKESVSEFQPSDAYEKIPGSGCRRCSASVLEEQILEEIHLNMETPDNPPFDPAALQSCIAAVEQAQQKTKRKQNSHESVHHAINEKFWEKNEPVQFEHSAFRRIRNLMAASSRRILLIQGLGLFTISIGSWILSLVLAEEMIRSPETAAGMAIGYACSAGTLLALLCLADRIHAAAYGMDELEAACPWNASAMLRYRIPAFALVSLGGLCLVGLTLSGAENLKVLMLGGAICFLLTMLGSLMTQESLNGMLMSGMLSLLCLLVFDFVSREGLSLFLSQNGLLTCGLLLMAILCLILYERRKFS